MDPSDRIALISEEFPPFTIGGLAGICYDLAYSLSKRGISTTVFCGKSSRAQVQRVSKYLDVVRLPFLDLPPRHIWFQMRNFRSVLKMLRDHAIVHGVSTNSSAIFAPSARKLRKPFVAHLQGSPRSERTAFLRCPVSYWSIGDFAFYVGESPMNSYLLGLSLAYSDRIVSCSLSALSETRLAYPKVRWSKATVLCNGINFDKLDSGATPAEEDGSLILHGRLFCIKGIIQLLKAIAIVRRRFPRVKLKVYGRGPLRTRIDTLIQKLGIANNVLIQGYVSRERIINEIRRASVVVLPSFYEAQSMSVLEAMACAKPVIALDLPFSRECIQDLRNGLLARPGDVQHLAEKISLALSDNKLRFDLGRNAYEHVKTNHDWDLLVDQYIEMYDGMLGDDRNA